MKTTTPQFETGASTHTVNDLILWIENDRESYSFIEKVYQDNQTHQIIGGVTVRDFRRPVLEGKACYVRNFRTSSEHVRNISTEELTELMRYFFDAYSDWSNENSYLPSMLVKFEDPSKNYRTSVSRTSTEQDLRDAFIGVSFGEDPAKVIDIEFTPATY
jgi:hypothetical protein